METRELTDSEKSEIIRVMLNSPDGRVELLRQFRTNLQQSESEIPTLLEHGIIDEVSADWLRAFIRLETESGKPVATTTE